MTGSSEQVELAHDGPVRTFWADGHYWRVYEMQAPSFDRRGGQHLIFESVEIVRRVRDFPEDWMNLPDANLYSLCDRRSRPR